jgi:hypothetical protein
VEDRSIAEAIAAVLIEGFDRHYRLFRETIRRHSGSRTGRTATLESLNRSE